MVAAPTYQSGSGTGLNWLYNMHMSHIYIYISIYHMYMFCTYMQKDSWTWMYVYTHTQIYIHIDTQCDNQTKWFQWERTMKHHLHLETLTWMKPTTQTWPANHQKHDPQITQTSLQSYLQKCFQNIIQHPFHDFKPALCSCTRRQGAASSQQQLFLAWMQSMGRRQVRETRQKTATIILWFNTRESM